MKNLAEQLKELPQIQPPVAIFDDVQKKLDKNGFIKKHRMISSVSIAAVLLIMFAFFNQKVDLDEKDILIEALVKRTMQLEQLLAEERPVYSMPGSQITEKIVNIEQYLVKLDEDIKTSQNKKRTSELMATKLDLLGSLVLLQRKINQKPDYQKVKPYII